MTKNAKSLRIMAVADELGVSDGTVRKWAETGIMKCTKLPSGERRFERSEVDRMKDVVRTNNQLLNDRPAIVVEARQKTTRDIRDDPERAFVLMNLLVDEIERPGIGRSTVVNGSSTLGYMPDRLPGTWDTDPRYCLKHSAHTFTMNMVAVAYCSACGTILATDEEVTR